jgi:hypothetical protein
VLLEGIRAAWGAVLLLAPRAVLDRACCAEAPP